MWNHNCELCLVRLQKKSSLITYYELSKELLLRHVPFTSSNFIPVMSIQTLKLKEFNMGLNGSSKLECATWIQMLFELYVGFLAHLNGQN